MLAWPVRGAGEDLDELCRCPRTHGRSAAFGRAPGCAGARQVGAARPCRRTRRDGTCGCCGPPASSPRRNSPSVPCTCCCVPVWTGWTCCPHRRPPPLRGAPRPRRDRRRRPVPDRAGPPCRLLSELAERRGTAVRRPTNAHWLDGASADARCCFAARRLDAEGVVLLFARAGTEGFPTPGLPGQLRLGPLDRAASRALLDEHSPNLPAQIADRVLTVATETLALLELPGTPTRQHRQWPHCRCPAGSNRRTTNRLPRYPPPTRTFLLARAAEETGGTARDPAGRHRAGRHGRTMRVRSRRQVVHRDHPGPVPPTPDIVRRDAQRGAGQQESRAVPRSPRPAATSRNVRVGGGSAATCW